MKRGALYPKGDEGLSVAKKGGSSNSAGRKAAQTKAPEEKKGRKQRAGDLGRALRTIYDDTLRENVPDDFMNLLGKLS